MKLGGLMFERRRVDQPIAEERRTKDCKGQCNILTALLNTSPVMFWAYQPEIKFAFANFALKEFLGHNGEDFVNKLETMNKEVDIIPATVKKEKKFLEVTKKPIYGSDGRLVGHCGSVKDVTKTLILKEKITEKLDEIENGNSHKLYDAQRELKQTINLINQRWSAQ
jgi:hypothetical protein